MQTVCVLCLYTRSSCSNRIQPHTNNATSKLWRFADVDSTSFGRYLFVIVNISFKNYYGDLSKSCIFFWSPFLSAQIIQIMTTDWPYSCHDWFTSRKDIWMSPYKSLFFYNKLKSIQFSYRLYLLNIICFIKLGFNIRGGILPQSSIFVSKVYPASLAYNTGLNEADQVSWSSLIIK